MTLPVIRVPGQGRVSRQRLVPGRLFFVVCFALLFLGGFSADEASPQETTAPEETTAPQETILPEEVYLLPQTVYVGDRGRLVVGLGPVFNEVPAFVRTAPDELPVVPDLTVSRMELEKRGDSVRLLVDFISYVPGTIVFPVLTIPAAADGDPLFLGGVGFTVASILTPDTMTLSAPALPLPAPGTGLYVYGGFGALLFLFILVIAALFSFNRFAGPFRKRFRKRKLLASLEQKMRLLRDGSLDNDPRARNETFALLSGEFREFLTLVTGVNCEALTPLEFAEFPAALPGVAPAYLGSLFRRWDDLRFSGSPVDRNGLLGIVNELDGFFDSLKKTEKSA